MPKTTEKARRRAADQAKAKAALVKAHSEEFYALAAEIRDMLREEHPDLPRRKTGYMAHGRALTILTQRYPEEYRKAFYALRPERLPTQKQMREAEKQRREEEKQAALADIPHFTPSLRRVRRGGVIRWERQQLTHVS